MRVLVTGAAGQLGSSFVRRFADRPVVALARGDLDIADEAAVLRAIEAARPDVVINCAAYNDVDGAEDDAVSALRVNTFGVLALAQAAKAVGATFVHYSTDFVFDGAGARPYLESDPPRPLSTYGASKLLGEWFARDAPQAYVLRVESLFGGPRAKSSVDRILGAIRQGRPARAFVDRTTTPSYVDDVVTATEQLLERRPAPGVYHCVNSGSATWFEIAQEAVRLIGSSAEVVPLTASDLTLKARRPQYCALSNAKLREAGIDLPSWQDALARYVAVTR